MSRRRYLCLAFLGAILAVAASADEGDRSSNRLIHEKSPYLRQHAHNPVDWYPWGEEAFARARMENKPIFLSVGYSTCHWCHVMERESFENEEIARVLNENFVCIKVDREERPDVDRVYMTFVQATTGGGGWPMSVWLTPDLKPFFGGTYFPPEDRGGRPGFKSMLTRIAGLWADGQDRVLAQSDRIMQALAGDTQHKAAEDQLPVAGLRARGLKDASDTFDAEKGGFGAAPKFPHPVMLEFLFDVAATSPDADEREHALAMALKTLRAMAAGGIHDQLGGGFCRYSVDADWFVPHFEKMLYDQAQLAECYLTAWQLSRDPEMLRTATRILDYVRRRMTGPGGGFLSAEDADSAHASDPSSHGEGAFYVWTQTEIEDVLGPDAAKIVAYRFGVEPGGNVAADPEGEFAGRNILHLAHTIEETAAMAGISVSDTQAALEAAIGKLFEARETRPRPSCDDKIITAWNGLMISAFARAAQITGDASYSESAVRAAMFLRERMFDAATGRLARSWRAGGRGEHGFAEDYAFLIQGLLDLYETTFDIAWLEWALGLQGAQDRLFWDSDAGGYFADAGEDASVLLRLKDDYDGAEPSANSIAVRNLARIAGMMHRDDLLERARHATRAFGVQLDRAPEAMPRMLASLGWLGGSPKQILIEGERGDAETAALLRVVWDRFHPRRVLLLVDRNGRAYLEKHVPFVENLPDETEGISTAYVCENFVCQLPTRDPAVLARLLMK